MMSAMLMATMLMVRVIIGHSVSMSTRSCKLHRLDGTSGQHDNSRSMSGRTECLPRCVVHLTGFAVDGRSQVLALANAGRGGILRV